MKLFAPLINDISTDLENPPPFSSRDSRLSDAVIESTKKHYASLESLRLSCSADDAFRLVLEAAERMERWKLTVIDRERRVLEGHAITGLLRFRDDFVVRVASDGDSDEDADTGAVVDMRSRSRKGKGDFGANAERIEAFFSLVRSLA